jgi:hypothetical protein
MTVNVEYTRQELKSLPSQILADLVLASALGCGDVVIARILKEAALRLRRQP